MSYIRKCSLIVYGSPPNPGGTGLAVPASPAVPATPSPVTISVNKSPAPIQPQSQQGLELSALRVQFRVTAMDIDQPPTAVIRVLNLADSTAQRIQKEFQNVVLQAGYDDSTFGVIFQGSIMRVRKGRLNNIETFVDICASNLDALYNFGVVNTTLKKGSSPTDRVNAIASSVNSSSVAQGQAGALQQGVQLGHIPDSFGTGGTLPRGKVMFGLWRDHMSDISETQGCTWQIGPDGVVNVVPLTGYLDSEAVVLTSQTGMIGVPESTPEGIVVESLLNSQIRHGTRIQLDNASITQTQNNPNGVGFPAYGEFQYFANTSNDGFYRAIVVEHEGDTRGEGDGSWITRITALNVDQSSSSVAAY